VAPNATSFAAAAATADWAGAKDFNLIMTNAPGAASYPIAATTFVLMYKQPRNAAASQQARKFFNWALAKGQPQANSLDYVPLPAPLVQRISRYMAANLR
jgi:phosphate transport system substrate-binding protein